MPGGDGYGPPGGVGRGMGPGGGRRDGSGRGKGGGRPYGRGGTRSPYSRSGRIQVGGPFQPVTRRRRRRMRKATNGSLGGSTFSF